jgi:hypothetical protein
MCTTCCFTFSGIRRKLIFPLLLKWGRINYRVIETTFCQYPRACVQASGYNHQVTLRSKWKMLTWNRICVPILSLKWSITKQQTYYTILVTRFNSRS